MEAMGRPDWKLEGAGNIFDFSKPEVRDYMISIYKEAIDFFGVKRIHIGGDEYFQSEYNDSAKGPLVEWAKQATGDDHANEYDALKLFFNQVAGELKAIGVQPIVWNDNIKVLDGPAPLDKDIIIDFWAASFYGSISTQTAVDAGYKVMSSGSGNYHDLWPTGRDSDTKLDRPEPRATFKLWNRYLYSHGSYYVGDNIDKEITSNPELTLGQMFPIWDDSHGFVPEYILSRTLFPRYASLSYLAWGAEKSTAGGNAYSYYNEQNYEQFERLMFDLGAPLDGKRKQVVVNYREVDLLAIANKIATALSSKVSNNVNGQARIAELKAKADSIIPNPENSLDKYGFATATISEIIYDYENLGNESSALKELFNQADDLNLSANKAYINAMVVNADLNSTDEQIVAAINTLKAAIDAAIKEGEENSDGETKPTPPSNEVSTEKVIDEIKNSKDNTITVDLSKLDVVSKDIFKAAKDAKKDVVFNIVDENGKTLYKWTFEGKNIKNTDIDINLDLKVTDLINPGNDQIKKLIKNGLVLSFAHDGPLPGKANVTIYVGDKYKDGDKLNLYYYNASKEKLKSISKNIVVKDGYVTISIEHCSDYVLVKANDASSNPQTNDSSIPMLPTLVIISLLGGAVFIKRKAIANKT